MVGAHASFCSELMPRTQTMSNNVERWSIAGNNIELSLMRTQVRAIYDHIPAYKVPSSHLPIVARKSELKKSSLSIVKTA